MDDDKQVDRLPKKERLALFAKHARMIASHVRVGRLSPDRACKVLWESARADDLAGAPGSLDEEIIEDVIEKAIAPTDDGEQHANANGHDREEVHDQGAPLPLPVIQIKGGELSSLATMAEDLLIAAGVPIYQRGGKLVRPIIETVDATHDRETKVAQLKVLDKVYTRDLLNRHAAWEKWDVRGKRAVPINPPEEIAATMLARAGDWTFPAIAGVISAPTMRPDGSLLLDAGYDAATRLLLVEPPPCQLLRSCRRSMMQRPR